MLLVIKILDQLATHQVKDFVVRYDLYIYWLEHLITYTFIG